MGTVHGLTLICVLIAALLRTPARWRCSLPEPSPLGWCFLPFGLFVLLVIFDIYHPYFSHEQMSPDDILVSNLGEKWKKGTYVTVPTLVVPTPLLS